MLQTYTTQITDKGYILLPVKVREALNLKPRQSVTISVDEKKIELKPLMTLEEVFAFVKSPRKRKITQKILKQEEEAAHRAIAENAMSEGI